MDFFGNSIKHQRKPQMATINQSRGANSKIYGSSGGLFEGGGLLKICSSRLEAYSRGAFSRGAHSKIYGIQCLCKHWSMLPPP